MKRPALIALFALAACADGDPAAGGRDDPERVAIELLTHHVFDPIEALRARCVEGVDPADLPLRLVVDAPDQYAFVDVWRLRMVDGRAIVSALVTLQGEPHVFDVWLEHRRGAWRLAVWERVPVPVDPASAAPPAGPALPVPLATATFRRVDEAPVLALDAPPAPGDGPGRTPGARVGFKAPIVEGPCDAARLRQHARALEGPLGRCYAEATAGAAPRAGRLTLAVTLDDAGAEGRPSAVRVAETTLLLSGFGACVEAAVRALPGWLRPGGATCTARLPVTFTPRPPR